MIFVEIPIAIDIRTTNSFIGEFINGKVSIVPNQN